MAKLTPSQRANLSPGQFAFPGSRSFPINDKDHREAALMDSHGKKHAEVKAAIARQKKK